MELKTIITALTAIERNQVIKVRTADGRTATIGNDLHIMDGRCYCQEGDDGWAWNTTTEIVDYLEACPEQEIKII